MSGLLLSDFSVVLMDANIMSGLLGYVARAQSWASAEEKLKKIFYTMVSRSSGSNTSLGFGHFKLLSSTFVCHLTCLLLCFSGNGITLEGAVPTEQDSQPKPAKRARTSFTAEQLQVRHALHQSQLKNQSVSTTICILFLKICSPLTTF